MKPFVLIVLLLFLIPVGTLASTQSMGTSGVLCPMDKSLTLHNTKRNKQTLAASKNIGFSSLQQEINFIYKLQTERKKSLNRYIFHIKRF